VETYPEREEGGALLDGDDAAPDASVPPFRGQHLATALLKDANVLVVGGAEQVVGSSSFSELASARMFSPPYLAPFLPAVAARPQWDLESMAAFDWAHWPQALNGSIEPLFLRVNSTAQLAVQPGVPLRSLDPSVVFPSGTGMDHGFPPSSFGFAGAVLMAASSSSHGQDSNQRAVPLAWADAESNRSATRGGLNSNHPIAGADGSDSPLLLRVRLPDVPVLVPGEYLLFLISAAGVPSSGLHVRVLGPSESAASAYAYPAARESLPSPAPAPSAAPGSLVPPGDVEVDPSPWTPQNVALISLLGGAGVGFFLALAVWFFRQQREEGECECCARWSWLMKGRVSNGHSPSGTYTPASGAHASADRHSPDSEQLMEMVPAGAVWHEQRGAHGGRMRLHSFDAMA